MLIVVHDNPPLEVLAAKLLEPITIASRLLP